jgi:hypothetical protein
MKVLMTIILSILFVELSAQKHTLFGYIKDKTTGETLIGATISIEDRSIGTASNNYGFYSLTIPQGKHRIECSYIGYQLFTKEMELNGETNLNIELEVKDAKLEEVVVRATKNNRIVNNEMSSQSLSISAIKQMPAVMGESDLMKSLQLLPGIQATNEGTTNLSIRGG